VFPLTSTLAHLLTTLKFDQNVEKNNEDLKK